jgi:hypothetical protein
MFHVILTRHISLDVLHPNSGVVQYKMCLWDSGCVVAIVQDI